MNPELGKSVHVSGIAVNYLDAGEGPPVILLHGSGPGVTAYANWRLVMPELAKRFRVLAPDIVGFGYTERPADARYTLDFWLQHLLGFVDAQGLAKASFVGNSFGGALALHFAARFPGRVDKLVLMGACALDFELTAGLDAVWGYKPSLANMRELLRVFVHDQSRITDDLANSRFAASMRPGYQEVYERLFPAPRQARIAELAVPEATLQSMQTKALVVHGREDLVIPPSVSVRLNQLLPNSELHMFGNCGHWTQVERSQEFAAQITQFVGRA